jgi:hypothetical protein
VYNAKSKGPPYLRGIPVNLRGIPVFISSRIALPFGNPFGTFWNEGGARLLLFFLLSEPFRHMSDNAVKIFEMEDIRDNLEDELGVGGGGGASQREEELVVLAQV